MPNSDFSSLFGFAADQVSNLFKGNKSGKPINTSTEPIPTTKSKATPKGVTPVNPPRIQTTTPKGIGEQYIDQEPIPGETLPIEETNPLDMIPITPEDAILKYNEALMKSGFKKNEENLSHLMESNPDPSQPITDFTGLKPEDNTILDSAKNSIRQTISETPIVQVMAGLKRPLDVIGEGFNRYEAAKVAFLSNIEKAGPVQSGLEVGKALTGKTEADESLQDATLRNSSHPELGDFFRKLGLPEVLSATGGFGLDILTDIPVALLTGLTFPKTVSEALKAGKGSKVAGEAVKGVEALGKLTGTEKTVEAGKEIGTKAFNTINEYLGKQNSRAENELEAVQKYVLDKYLKYSTSEVLEMMKEAATGKGALDAMGPALKNTLIQNSGADRVASTQAHIIKDGMNNLFSKIAKADLPKIADEALHGSLDALAKLPTDVQTLVKQGRTLIDSHSLRLNKTLTDLYNSDKATFDKMAERFGVEPGKQIPLPQLIKTIKENVGNHVHTSYALFSKGFDGWKPTEELYEQAIDGLLADKKFATPAEARAFLQSTVDNKSFMAFGEKSKPYKVDISSFIKKQEIPPYLEAFYGKVDDPRYNLVKTVESISKAESQIKFFQQLKDNKMVSSVPTDKMSYQIPKGKGLAWAGLEDQYVNKEVHDFLKGTQIAEDMMDSTLVKSMQFLKFAKTIPNVKTGVHNVIGNFFNSLITGISPVSHPHRYFGKGGALDIIKAGWQYKRGKLPESDPLVQRYLKAVSDTIIENELPNADNIHFIENLETQFTKHKVPESFRKVGTGAKTMADIYSAQDQFFKLAHWLEYSSKGLKGPDLINEVYKHWTNYSNAPRLAQALRSTPAGLMLGNQFATFRIEQHRILLNHLKDPDTRWKTAALFASTGLANIALLTAAGNSFKDIQSFFDTRPEAYSDVMLNPVNKNYDINLNYIDPYDRKGLFAPLLYAAGHTNVNPFDYLLGFTQFSPEFGYSNLITNALEAGITGKTKFGQEMTPGDTILEVMKQMGPTSFTSDIPKIINPDQPTIEEDGQERIRRIFKFAGVDLEKRNPTYLKSRISKSLIEGLKSGEDITPLLNTIRTLGYDPDKLIQSAERKIKDEGKQKPKASKEVAQPDLIDRILKNL